MGDENKSNALYALGTRFQNDFVNNDNVSQLELSPIIKKGSPYSEARATYAKRTHAREHVSIISLLLINCELL